MGNYLIVCILINALSIEVVLLNYHVTTQDLDLRTSTGPGLFRNHRCLVLGFGR